MTHPESAGPLRDRLSSMVCRVELLHGLPAAPVPPLNRRAVQLNPKLITGLRAIRRVIADCPVLDESGLAGL
jgi:hypothetical protein